MNITPIIPDGYNGPIKQLTCRICKHLFYITHGDDSRLPEVRFCHGCSPTLLEELQNNRGANTLRAPTATKAEPVVSAPPHLPLQLSPPVRMTPPRTIDREKMTVEQLLEEARMLRKTWRYKGALRSYEEVLRLEPASAKASSRKGWALAGLKRYEEAFAAFGAALQLDPSHQEASTGKRFFLTHLHRDEEAKQVRDPETERAPHHADAARPFHTAQDYYQRGHPLSAF